MQIKYYKGIVEWYDYLVGEGMIRDKYTGERVYFHKSALTGPKNVLERGLKEGDKVDYLIYRDLCFKQIPLIRLIDDLT